MKTFVIIIHLDRQIDAIQMGTNNIRFILKLIRDGIAFILAQLNNATY